MANVYYDQGKLNEALEYYKRSLSIIERVKGEESFESANTLRSIGLLYDDLG